jgi:predicted phosphodiesterase
MMVDFKETLYSGLLVIGDPHLEGRVPGFRKDDYPNVILEKLRWSLNYATTNALLPVILGDFFTLPRDNPNWLLVKLLQLFDQEAVAIYGNHDIHEDEIGDDDSLSILAEGGKLRLLDARNQFFGTIGGRPIVIGGTPWGQQLPDRFDVEVSNVALRPLVFWLTHHDIVLPGYEELGRFKPRELPGIDAIINGHIHRRLESVQIGQTLWLTPGNISRRTRSDATRAHVPSVLRININATGWQHEYVEVPHRPFDDVFHEEIADEHVDHSPSAFVTGLAELQHYRTQAGEGLTAFLERNLGQFENDVATEIRKLSQEVIGHV